MKSLAGSCGGVRPSLGFAVARTVTYPFKIQICSEDLLDLLLKFLAAVRLFQSIGNVADRHIFDRGELALFPGGSIRVVR